MAGKRKRRAQKLHIFIVIRIVILAFGTILTSGAIAILLAHILSFQNNQKRGILLFFLWVLICTCISHLLTYKTMHGTVRMFEKLSDATKEVAKGNFDVQVSLDRRQIDEMEDLCHNFNQMVKELGTIETLRNDFVADVSHEFKTPISAIEGYAMLLQDETLTEEEKRAYVDSIIYNSRRLSNLTGNILMISRLENDTIKLNPTHFSLDEQIRRIILTFEEKWSEKNLELDIDLDAVQYYGDEDLLYHVWLNLLSNAIKFSNPGGLLVVKLLNNHYNVEVIVEDHGIGMDEAAVQRIYEKFYQSDSSRASEGNGLGMTLVKKICDICHGEIAIESKVGQGTKFTISLPVE
jgi:signal transduction histidine kinase